MLRTIEAVAETGGRIRILEQVEIPAGTRLLVTVMEEENRAAVADAARLDLQSDLLAPQGDEYTDAVQRMAEEP